MSDTHGRWMRRCLELAVRAEGRTHPNPMVGCVIVSASGKLVAEGHHREAGGPHAEVVALRKAGRRARGATVYVSLEPCNHHGRTPPCAPQLLEAGVARVVYGARDPIQGHAGGARALRRAGIEVVGPILEDECRTLNAGFFSVVERGRPWVVAKTGMSLDGKISTRTGQSRWITGPQARARGHQLRNRLDAIMVGIGTVRADDPQLTTRGVRSARDPIRVVVDSRLRTPTRAALLPANSESSARCIIAATRIASAAAQRRLEAKGAEVWRVRRRKGRVDLRALLERLAGAGVTTVLLEGGGELMGSALEDDRVDELELFVAPGVIGGPAPSWVGGRGRSSLEGFRGFELAREPARLGEDAWLHLLRVGGYPARRLK